MNAMMSCQCRLMGRNKCATLGGGGVWSLSAWWMFKFSLQSTTNCWKNIQVNAPSCFIYILLDNNPPPKMSNLKQWKCITSKNAAVWAQLSWKILCFIWYLLGLECSRQLLHPRVWSTTSAEAWYSIFHCGLSRVAGSLYLMAYGSKAVSKRTSPSSQVLSNLHYKLKQVTWPSPESVQEGTSQDVKT